MVDHLADHDGTLDASILGDLPNRRLQRPADDADPGLLVFIVAFDLQGFRRHSKATPPPGTMPSSTAARVAFSASSTRSFLSFTSVSVDPPTLITATPPASFASRSCSFSLS